MINIDKDILKVSGSFLDIINELGGGISQLTQSIKKEAPELICDMFMESMIVSLAIGYANLEKGSGKVASNKENELIHEMAKEVLKSIKIISKAVEAEQGVE